jgi:hypothetical protein
MAAPTKPANVKKVLANSEPSTHGTSRYFAALQVLIAIGAIADNAGLAVGSTRLRLTRSGHWPNGNPAVRPALT